MPVSTAPALTGVNPNASLVQAAPAVPLSSNLVITDSAESSVTGATVSITAGLQSGDALTADTYGTSITALYDAATGVLTLSGSDTLANYQKVLRSVSLAATSIQAPGGAADTTRTIQWRVSDAAPTNSAVTTTTATISAADAADFILNPLPHSVELDPSLFTVKLIGSVPLATNGDIHYGAYGDLTGDGYPEIVLSGWDSNPEGNPNDTPPQMPIYVFSALPDGTVMDNAQALLGLDTDYGTGIIRIADFNNDGHNDLVIVGHNETPIVATQGIEFLSNGSGGFNIVYPVQKTAAHEGAAGDVNGDGLLDMVLSTYKFTYTGLDPAYTGSSYQPGGLFLWINQGDGTFKPLPVDYNYPLSQLNAGGLATQSWNGGSASYIADLDGDGKPEIVVVDSETSLNGGVGGDSYIVSNLTLGSANAYGTLIPLPTPYFEDPKFSSVPSYYTDRESHNIQISVMDIDGDGLPDILIDEMIFSPTVGIGAGVVQILHNNGNLNFTDVTNQDLYNAFIGKVDGGHETDLIDVNGDGFLDIVMPGDGANAPSTSGDGSNYESLANTWSNDILINTGDGKFVSVATDTFHDLTLEEQPAFQSVEGSNTGPFYSLDDGRDFPYVLPDGTIGFVTQQTGYIPGVGQGDFFFDIRGKISTGPGGIDPAPLGAPGFNEAYYLTQYPDVAAAVTAGTYASGLAQYLAVGRAAGNYAFAAGATVNGYSGNDTIVLREGNETANGDGGDDTITGGAGNDTIDGGAGLDRALYSGASTSYAITRNPDGSTTISGPDGTDTLTNVEQAVFTDRTVTIGIGAPSDFDGDGRAELLWQNLSGQPTLWFQSGGTVSTSAALINPGPSWHVIGTGDFDGDGKADLLWRNNNGDTSVWLMNGSTLSGNGDPGNPGADWHEIATGDFDGDGKSDVLLQNDNGQAAIWLMNGSAITSAAAVGPNPGPSWQVVAAGDLDGDGNADMVWQGADGTISVWFMNGTTLASGSLVNVNPGPDWHVVATGDFDGDGKADLLLQNDNGQAAIWLMNGATVTGGAWIGSNPGPSWHVMGTGDFNGDGNADIIWQNNDGQAAIWEMNGLTISNAYLVGAAQGDAMHIANDGQNFSRPRSDLDGDGRSDIVLQNSGSLAVWFMNGASTTSVAAIGPALGSDYALAGIGDFNGDGTSDLLINQVSTGQLTLWFMNGSTILPSSAALSVNAGTSWQVKATGDFNADGVNDIVLQNSNGDVSLWFMNGTSVQAGSGEVTNPGPSWQVVGAGDFDGDGKSDILLQNSDGTVDIWFMNGLGIVSAPAPANPGAAWHVVGTGDFDGDGKDDILLQNDSGQASIWFMNGGTFTNAIAAGPNPGSGWSLKGSADLDGDGKAEMLWQNNSTGQVSAWFLSGSTLTSTPAIGSAPGAAWHVVAQAS